MKNLLLIVSILALPIVGCAIERPPIPHAFSQDELHEIDAECVALGCVVVPAPLWILILSRLHAGEGA